MAGNLCILNKTIMTKINSKVKNSRVSIKSKDIILDYEFFLHNYLNEAELRQKGLVPVEMYPYEGDVIIGYIPVDEQFGTVDLEALYKWALEQIEKEKLPLQQRLQDIADLFDQRILANGQFIERVTCIDINDDLRESVLDTIKEVIEKLSK
jgi:hypothetical protein